MGKNILTKELLLKSVEEWNAAREANQKAWGLNGLLDFNREVNLSGADLRGADLRDANLSDANLYQADFRGANLNSANLFTAYLNGANFTGANLSNVDFSYATLSSANLSESDLDNADLSEAYLNGADLSGANLYGTDLSRAELNKVNFNRAIVGDTTFVDLDLSGAIGLDTVWHRRPSTIGIDTLYKSNGDIPDVFLRGCGLPDAFIKAIHDLKPKASDYYSCFISHSSVDKVFVDRLYADLQAKGVPCYYAHHDLPIGAKTRLTLHEEIRNHDKLLLVLSEHSVKSAWVEDEVEHGFDLERERGMPVLFPIRLDDAVMESKTGWASSVKSRNIGDFTKWKDHDAYKNAFERLLKDLKQ